MYLYSDSELDILIFGKLNVELETLKRGERKMIDSYGEI